MPRGPLFPLSSVGGGAEGREVVPLPIRALSASRPRCLRSRRCTADSCPSFGDAGRGDPVLTDEALPEEERADNTDELPGAASTAALGLGCWETGNGRSVSSGTADEGTDDLRGGVGSEDSSIGRGGATSAAKGGGSSG